MILLIILIFSSMFWMIVFYYKVPLYETMFHKTVRFYYNIRKTDVNSSNSIPLTFLIVTVNMRKKKVHNMKRESEI